MAELRGGGGHGAAPPRDAGEGDGGGVGVRAIRLPPHHLHRVLLLRARATRYQRSDVAVVLELRASRDRLRVYRDSSEKRVKGGPNPVKGDMFVIAGSMLYAVSNVSEEYLVKNGDRIEMMAMLGAFGAVLPFVGFALAMFLFYSTVPIILKICGATMLNLSLLTSDMWAVLIRIFAYHQKVDWMYFVAFAGVAIGLIIYSKGSKEEDQTAQVAEVNEEEHKEADEEAAIEGPVQTTSTADGHSSIQPKQL
ncbi:Solute carrier family 35 member F1 [Ananas comosus]|uniref:Solute carrier family 35 member F1 n=1 Tax=Ananas comosus TaxID=4615 RepID=A0A199W8L9_ANACO|nr:Solute carrier family 35 member F1 [Ananas comosus]